MKIDWASLTCIALSVCMREVTASMCCCSVTARTPISGPVGRNQFSSWQCVPSGGTDEDTNSCWVCFLKLLIYWGSSVEKAQNSRGKKKNRWHLQRLWVSSKWEYTHDLDSMSHCEISVITCVRRQAERWNVGWFKVTLAFWLIVLPMHHRGHPRSLCPLPCNALPPSSNTSFSSVVAPFKITLQ